MNIANQIKGYRQRIKLSQQELADKIFVSRQTISNWENQKNYPDINSLILLSQTFNITLDELIQGDIEIMKVQINQCNVQEFKNLSNLFSIFTLISVLSLVPLLFFFKFYGLITWIIIYTYTMFLAIKVDKLKKANDVFTYKQIIAFSEGKKLDEIQNMQENAKKPYQKIFIVIGFVTFCILINMILFVLFS